MRLILEPKKKPKLFAWNERLRWFVQRTPRDENGENTYICFKKEKNSSAVAERIEIKTKWFLDFYDQLCDSLGMEILFQFDGQDRTIKLTKKTS